MLRVRERKDEKRFSFLKALSPLQEYRLGRAKVPILRRLIAQLQNAQPSLCLYPILYVFSFFRVFRAFRGSNSSSSFPAQEESPLSHEVWRAPVRLVEQNKDYIHRLADE